MSKPLDFKLYDVKDGQMVIQTFSFANWHLGEIEKAIKDSDEGSVISCLWDFMKRIKIDKQYLQYMEAHGMPPKEWIDPLPKMIMDNEGNLVRDKE